MAVGILHLHQPGDPQDEGALLIYADHVIHGAVAQRDYLTFYGPGLSWLLGALFLVAGPDVVVERLLGVFLAAAVAFLMARIATRWGPGRGALAGAMSAIWLVSLPPSSSPWLAAILLLLASLLVSTPVDARPQRPCHFVAAGLLAALALTFRIDLAPAMVLSALPLLVGRPRRWGWYLAGATIGIIPLAVHVVVASPAAVFRDVFVEAVLVQAPGRRLPIPPANPATAVFFVATVAAGLCAVGATLVARRREAGISTTRLVAALAVLSAALMPEMFQRDDSTHVYYAACVCVATLPVSLSVIREARFAYVLRLVAPGVFVGFIIAAFLVPVQKGFEVSNQGRSFYVTSTDLTDTRSVLAHVDRLTVPGWRLFVGPADLRRTNYNSTYLYFLLPRLRAATYQLEMEPLVGNAASSHLAADVASADILVLTTEWDQFNEPNGSGILGPDAPNQVVSRLFCLRATDGVYRVYTRCAP